MQKAGAWLQKSSYLCSYYWSPENLTEENILKNYAAKPEEFYTLHIDNVPAGAAIFQTEDPEVDYMGEDTSIMNGRKTIPLTINNINSH